MSSVNPRPLVFGLAAVMIAAAGAARAAEPDFLGRLAGLRERAGFRTRWRRSLDRGRRAFG
jgi:hypothetical protein